MAAARLQRLALSIGLVALLTGAGPWTLPAAASSPYLLPLPGGTHVMVTQGNGGGHTGWEAFAWDFAVFGSTDEFPVVAARAGTVIGIEGGYKSSQHCNTSKCWTLANYVLVDQGDNTSALYLHLAENSLKVAVGQKVTQGQALGRADCTGWSTGNHLHFQVQEMPSQDVLKQVKKGTAAAGWWFRPSISVAFADSSVLERDPDGIPTYADSYPDGYLSGNAKSSGATTKPGGVWISPATGSTQAGSLHVSAHAYPATKGDPAVARVDFTVWWPALGAKSGPWKTGCTATAPTSGDQYGCDLSPADLGAPSGRLLLSFDVYDSAGGSNLSPNGERTVSWAFGPDVVGDGWQTYQGDGYVVDYPGAARSQSVPASSTYGLYSANVSYYSVGPDSDPTVIYMVEHLTFASALNVESYDYTALMKETLSYYYAYSPNTDVTQRDISVDGYKGLYFKMVDNDASAEFELVTIGSDVYMVIAGHYTSDSTLDSQRFFQSFHLD
jgi:murein DD-endopeptidase MepM/ murein hydrolase activator NlpD